MELVRGKSITAYCDEKRFSLRQRLKLFGQVCNALEHAHQKGIIHRDIKPTNIMVTNHDGVPVPKIIDFGIAKAIDESLTEKTLFTRYGEMVGTPLYMSPEQAEMSEPDVDTRTDIYSLGVVLYELLTGTPPFHDLSNNSFHEIRDAIRSSEPQLASTRINNLGDTVKQVSLNRDTDERSLHHHLKGELDWILMKCLSRDRSQRYQSAGELSKEIDRFLNGEPIDAAAPTIRYRMQKFVGKHKGAVAVASSFALLLLITSLFSIMMAVKASRAEGVASAKCRELVKERDRAVAAEQRLAELERQQRNRVAIHQAASTHNANVVKRFLANPEKLAGVTANVDLPSLEVKRMGNIWNASTIELKPSFSSRQTRTTYNAEFSAGEPIAVTQMIGDDQDEKDIEVIIVTGEGDDRESLLKSILKNQRAAFGENDVVVAQTLKQLGDLMSDKEQWQQSEAYLREAFEILKEKADDNPRFLSEIRVQLVNALKKQGNLEKAVVELRELKNNLSDADVPGKLTDMMDRLKIEVQRTGENQ